MVKISDFIVGVLEMNKQEEIRNMMGLSLQNAGGVSQNAKKTYCKPNRSSLPVEALCSLTQD